MRKHTPEPWKFWGDKEAIVMDKPLHSKHGFIAVMACNEDVSARTSSANARRIVACVNSCKGMETEHLENQSMLGETLLDRFNLLKSEAGKLTKQRDELLAALQGMIDIASDSQGVAGYHLNGAVADWDEFEEWQAACDAIAKAKGGAVNHFPDAEKMVPDGCHALMTLDEAIAHANEKSIGDSQCAAQHAQLAKWLNDYRAMLAAAPKLGGE